MDKKMIITIGREFGSGGQEIGELLGKKLGIPVYDREIIEMCSAKLLEDTDTLEDYDEAMETTNLSKTIFESLKFNVKQDQLFRAESEVIKDIASKESCIIIGRCGDHILKDIKNALHIFIYAPYGVKYNYVLDTYNLTHEASEKMLYQVDKARHNYYKRYTKMERGVRDNKQILIDSSVLGIEGTSNLLETLIKGKFKI